MDRQSGFDEYDNSYGDNTRDTKTRGTYTPADRNACSR